MRSFSMKMVSLIVFTLLSVFVIYQFNKSVPHCRIVGDFEFFNGRCIPYCPPHPSECGD